MDRVELVHSHRKIKLILVRIDDQRYNMYYYIRYHDTLNIHYTNTDVVSIITRNNYTNVIKQI